MGLKAQQNNSVILLMEHVRPMIFGGLKWIL